MLDELFKILTDEPERIEKIIIRSIKILFTVVIAAWLYKITVGAFIIFPVDSYQSWINFILSGRIFICIIMYLLTHYIVIALLKKITLFSVTQVSRLFTIDKKDLGNIFKRFGVFNFTHASETPTPGKNIQILERLTEVFIDEEDRKHITYLQNTFIENVLHLSVIFCFIYFVVIPGSTHSTVVTIVIIFGLGFSTFFYIGIHAFTEFMLENYKDLIYATSYVKTNHIIYLTFIEYGIVLIRPDRESGLKNFRTFKQRNKEYIVIHVPQNLIIKAQELQILLSGKKQQGKFFILITQKDLIPDIPLLSIENENLITVIEYTDEENLSVQLREFLKNFSITG